MRARQLLPALVLALLLSPSQAAAFRADCPYGVNAHQASNDALDLAAAAGIAWVRFDMNWFQFEPSQGAFDWTIADRFMDRAALNGQHVFVTVAYTPSWAVGAPCNDADPNPVNRCLNAPSADPSYWTDFVTAAVQRYSATVKHWGMWNEPNLERFYQGPRNQYVDEILVPGSDAVHAACSDCQVLGPDLAHLREADWDSDEGTCLFGQCMFNGWNHSLAEILDAAGSAIDIITHHKYQDPAADWWAAVLDGEHVLGVQLMNGVKEVTDAHGQGQPVWITEFGWETQPFGSHDPSYAASQVASIYTGREAVLAGSLPGPTNQPWPELDKLFVYDLHDDPSGFGWGLLDASLNLKPGYSNYASTISLLGDCSEPAPGDDDDTTAGDDDTTPGDDDDTPDSSDDDEADDDRRAAVLGCACSTGTSAPGGATTAWLLLALALFLHGRGKRPAKVAEVRVSGRV